MERIVLLNIRDVGSDFWKLSGVLDKDKKSHNPYLLVQNKDGIMQIEVVFFLKELLAYSDENALVLYQWEGEWRSDWFSFSIKQLREHV